MGIKDVLLNVATFGAHHRVQKANEEYHELAEELEELNELHEKRKLEINEILKKVIAAKKDAIIKIREVKKITDSLNVKERQAMNHNLKSDSYSLDKIDASISAGEIAINATKGSVAGVSTALGTWALVGSFGAASTGTAISTLSGAAASNAILAWLGGGSIAAGGGGMAVGSVVLGGLVAIPLLAITGVFQHLSANKQIKQIKEEELKIIKYIKDIKQNMVMFDALELRSNELLASLDKAMQAFHQTFRKTSRTIYPLGILSRIIKKIKKRITGKMFSSKDLDAIGTLGYITVYVLKIVDSPVM